MLRLVIHSRVGNGVLAVLGALYFVSAAATLAFYVVTNWGSNTLTDYVLQAALLAAATGGILFLLIAASNLRDRSRRPGAKAGAQSTSPMSAHPAL